jgi:hypothetical protein
MAELQKGAQRNLIVNRRALMDEARIVCGL